MKVDSAGGPSGMIADYLKGCCKEAKREKDTEGRSWELVVQLLQVMFRYSAVPEEIVWVKMVPVPKGKGEYRGVGLV